MTKQVDVVKNLFNKKYTRSEIISVLASLEKNKPLFIKLIKKYHPMYYLQFDNSIASFTLIMDINLAYGKDKYFTGKE
jgi:hypothetical protein